MAFGLLLALNHAQPTFDPSLLVLLGGCTFVALRLCNILIRHTDPFTPVQLYVWEKLTCLCMTHPHREVGILATGTGGTHTHASDGGREESEGVPGERSDVTVQSVMLGKEGVDEDGSRVQQIPESLRQRKVLKSVGDESSAEHANTEGIEEGGEEVSEGGEGGKDSQGEEPATIGSGGGGDGGDDDHLKRD